MQTDSVAPKGTRRRRRLGVSLAVPILFAAPAAWSVWWATETVPGNAVVSERVDQAPGTIPLTDLGRIVAPNALDGDEPRGLVPSRVGEALPQTPRESVVPPVPAPPPVPQPPADPPLVISVPGVKRDDAIAVVEDLIDASLPAIEKADGKVDPMDAVSPPPRLLGS